MQLKVSGHPRLHMTAETLSALKGKAKTTHAFYYGKLIEAADTSAAAIAKGEPRIRNRGDNNRGFGDILPVLSMAYLLSGDEKYLAATRSIVSQIVAFDTWGDQMDLVAGHFMAGVAIAYDWLYDDWTPEERTKIAAKLGSQAEILHFMASKQRIWWHDYFLHNWAHVITGGLALAASALQGDDDRAPAWMDYVDGFFTDVEEALPEDGSYQEGLSYMSYAWECILRYFDLSRQLYGRDHWGAEWLRKVPYHILHSTVPSPKHFDSAAVFGDGPRHYEWHGPAHTMFRSAAEYRDGVIQGFTKYLVGRGIGISMAGTWLNMLWYDPTLEAKESGGLPTFHFLPEIPTVMARSSWNEDAMMVAFKCTNNVAKKTMKNYPGRDLGSGHSHPDANSFQVYAFGEWLAVDPGYTQYKQSANHNTILVSGIQQYGGERTWFDAMETFGARSAPDIDRAESTESYDYARGDASGFYRPRARLARFVRHMVFLKPGDLLVVDELEGEVERDFEWRLHADEEIVESGGAFHVKKNAVRMRVALLAPDDLATEVRQWDIERSSSNGIPRTVLLTAAPTRPVKATVIAALLTPYKGEKPASEVKSFGIDGGKATLVLARSGRTDTLTLDMAAGKVTLA